ncbi:hypothetical protein LCGC14_0797280 [marine sediment metagenome]|uniref:HTH tetR-type domain-containing protein n=1 Tax=marine sediment metagenome TaxID=412755 RepID=A0A0F9SAQ7_9ZZZZ
MSTSETKEKLLETALTLIWQSSYSSVGVNEICRQAGVTKGAFYHHFSSKASLFCEATTFYWQVIKHDLDAILSPINTPLEQLENLIQFLIKSKLGKNNERLPGCPFFNAGAQMGTDDEQVMTALMTLSTTAIAYNRALINALNNGDYLIYEMDSEQLARLMYNFINGCMNYANIQRDAESIINDLPIGLYRLLGLKQEHWFSTKATWADEPSLFLS